MLLSRASGMAIEFAKRITIRHSSFDYPIYLQVMKAIEGAKDSTRNLKFFVPYAGDSS
jgi:hypothetical protein